MKQFEGAPFKKLEKSDLSSNIYELPSSPDKLVRRYFPATDFYGKISDKEAAAKTIKLFGELKDFHIPSPAAMVVAKYENDREGLYIVTDRIEGRDLNDAIDSAADLSETEQESLSGELAELYGSLVDYLESKLDAGGYFLSDIFSNRQYVYGRRRGEKEPHIYLVDTDPFLSKADKAGNMHHGVWLLDAEVDRAKPVLGSRAEEILNRIGKLKKLVVRREP